MDNIIKFLISIVLVLLIFYFHKRYENFSVGKCYDNMGGEKVINNDGTCSNYCYCFNGSAIDQKNMDKNECLSESRQHCYSCDEQYTLSNNLCYDEEGNFESLREGEELSQIDSTVVDDSTTVDTVTDSTTADTVDESATTDVSVTKETIIEIYTYDTSTNGNHDVTFNKDVVVDILIVGGGGGGGGAGGTGGSAGELKLLKDVALDKGKYNITIGKGGDSSYNGENSNFNDIVSNGGGGGESPSLQTGLRMQYFNSGYCGDDAAWFEDKVPNKTGLSTNGNSLNEFTNDALIGESGSKYSFLFTGFFEAKWNGHYYFYTNSDDASYLWIGPYATSGYTIGNANVKNGKLHGQQWKGSGWKKLNKGYYPIRIQMGNYTGGQHLEVTFMCYKRSDWVYDTTPPLPSYYHSMGGDYIKGTGGNGSQSAGDESGKGGDGVFEIEGINLKSHFNLDDSIGTSEGSVDKIYFAGGGSGRVDEVGGLGGGGMESSGSGVAYPGKNHTGSGGSINTSGGSGVVVIKYEI